MNQNQVPEICVFEMTLGTLKKKKNEIQLFYNLRTININCFAGQIKDLNGPRVAPVAWSKVSSVQSKHMTRVFGLWRKHWVLSLTRV